MDNDSARALLAGLIAGAATAFATTAIALVTIARSEHWRRYAVRERTVPLPLLGVVVVNGAMLGWTALGLVLGAGYLRAASRHPAAGLGSPNWLFSMLVTAGALLAFALVTIVRRRFSTPVGASALLATAAFGWLLPNLAR